MMAWSPYFFRIKSKVLSKAASFSREGEAELFFVFSRDRLEGESVSGAGEGMAVLPGKVVILWGRSNRESCTGAERSDSFELRIPKSLIGSLFQSSSNNRQAAS